MAINFPSSPAVDQVFSSGGTSWTWDGTTWNLYLGGNLITAAALSSALASYALSTSPSIAGTATFVNKPSMPGIQDSIPYQASAPSSPSEGDYYVNSSQNVLYVYTGAVTGWVSLGGSGSSPDDSSLVIAQRMFA